RMVTTLKHLKKLGIHFAIRRDSEDATVSAISSDINAILANAASTHSNVVVYTDGSSDGSPNSGCGIYITDPEHNPLWKGGMIVGSDGNNFSGEIGAAAVVVKACPSNLKVNLRIDSTAAIGALKRGRVSERKRVRAAGRPWLNFCRNDFEKKKDLFSIEHVR